MLLAGIAAGCGGSNPPQRGFDSRELLPFRDSTTLLWAFADSSGDPSLIYSTTPAGASALSYWSLDVVTGNVQSLGTLQPPSITALNGPYFCSLLQLDPTGGTETIQVTDLRTGAIMDVPDVLSYAACPGSDGILTAFIRDSMGSSDLVSGPPPYTAFQVVRLSMNVQGFGDWLFDASGKVSGALVAAASTTTPDAFGLYRLDLPAATFTEELPPAPVSTAWATGASPTGALQSASLATGPAQSIRAVGDHFVYTRAMSDGGTTMFAGPFAGGPASELALFQTDPGAVSFSFSSVDVFTSDDDGVPVTRAPVVGWAPGVAGSAASTLMVWDDAGGVIVGCPSSPGATPFGVLSPDGSRALFSGYPAAPGAVSLLSLGAATGGTNSCLALTDSSNEAGTGADFSPDGQALFWTVATGPIATTVESAIWAAAADGSSPRMLGNAGILGASFIAVPGSERLQFFLDDDLCWVDLRDDPIVVHDVAQASFDGYDDLPNSWLLAGYDYNAQDGNGTLGFVNLDNPKNKHPISASVVSFRMTADRTAPEAGAPEGGASGDGGSGTIYDIVYLVRGRNPSSQDGFWLAKVNPADLK